jgi:hypothetical protein
MWPFSEMSLEAASLWSDIANWSLIVCLIGGVLATLGIVQTTNVKERHWDSAREQSAERVKELEGEALRAKADLEAARADIAQANAASATANARAEEAKLELAKFRQPRSLSSMAQERIAMAMRPFSGTTFNVAVSNAQEPVNLLGQLEDSLVAANWKQIAWPADTVLQRGGRPSAGIATEVAVTIQVEEAEKGSMLQIARALVVALTAEGIEADVRHMPPASQYNMKQKVIHVVVGEKPR